MLRAVLPLLPPSQKGRGAVAPQFRHPWTSCTKLLELYYDVTVQFSSILKEAFEQITAKQQIIKLESISLSYEQWRIEKFYKGGAIISTFFRQNIFEAD